MSLEWKLKCLWNVICLINFFEGPRYKVPVVFGRLLFKVFGTVCIPDSMVTLVIAIVHLSKLNFLFCHVYSFLNLPGTSHGNVLAEGEQLFCCLWALAFGSWLVIYRVKTQTRHGMMEMESFADKSWQFLFKSGCRWHRQLIYKQKPLDFRYQKMLHDP